MNPKNKKDYYSVPSKQTAAFAKAIAPYLSKSMKDIGSKATIEDIIKRVQLGSEPGGIQVVLSDLLHSDFSDKSPRLAEYNYRYKPSTDFYNLYKDKRSEFVDEEDMGKSEYSQKLYEDMLKENTLKSKSKSEKADTIRLFINPQFKTTDKGIDALYKGSPLNIGDLLGFGRGLGGSSMQEKVETLAHELMHAPSFEPHSDPLADVIRVSNLHEEGYGPTSQYGYKEAIKKHITEPTAEVGYWDELKGNKRKYIPPKNRLFRSFEYEYEPGYERDRSPEKAMIDILSRWAEQQ